MEKVSVFWLEYFRRKLGQDYETRPDESNSVPYDRRRDDL